MASIDPRKKESITNQANYLMTIVTTLLGGMLLSSSQSGIWSVTAYLIMGGLWIMAGSYREIKKVIEVWTEREFSKSLPKTPIS